MTATFFWWIAAAVLIGAELITGTFYLAVLAVAAALAAIAAHFELGWTAQVVVACVAGVLGCLAVNRWRSTQAAVASPLDALDAGQTVRVLEWRADGTARVAYRGSTWDAELADTNLPQAEVMAIVGTRGNTLVIGKPSI